MDATPALSSALRRQSCNHVRLLKKRLLSVLKQCLCLARGCLCSFSYKEGTSVTSDDAKKKERKKKKEFER